MFLGTETSSNTKISKLSSGVSQNIEMLSYLKHVEPVRISKSFVLLNIILSNAEPKNLTDHQNFMLFERKWLRAMKEIFKSNCLCLSNGEQLLSSSWAEMSQWWRLTNRLRSKKLTQIYKGLLRKNVPPKCLNHSP